MGVGRPSFRLVLIEWEDSHSDGVWQQLDVELEDRALVCRSVGWLVLDGERAKVIVPHLSDQEDGVPLQGCGIMTIPGHSGQSLTSRLRAIRAFA